MQCSQCQHANPDGAKFCNACAAPLAQHCPACATQNPAGAKFCHQCATPLAAQPATGNTPLHTDFPTTSSPLIEAERRQLTVMFCDLADSTPLAERLDPEDLREVMRAYQQTCAAVIQRFDGHVAQLLGDALLVYFGWPQAHEDDAQRAVRSGVAMLEAMATLNRRLAGEKDVTLAIRIGIHTGLVVVGEMGGGAHREQLALGETPNLASRLQHLAEPDTVVISDAIVRLVEGYVRVTDLGLHALKGVAAPVRMYRVLGESGAQSRVDIVTSHSLTPLVGRESEVSLLREQWQRAKEGHGQVVLMRGEAGIGKSRLVQVLKHHVVDTPSTMLECRSSPYDQHTPWYALIDLWERAAGWQRDDTAAVKLEKLARMLKQYTLAVDDTLPLFATLLSITLPAQRYPPPSETPQRQRQQLLDTMLTLLLQQAERQPFLFILEDLHWTDPSTLEWLDLLIGQAPTVPLLMVLTCRPSFQPSWGIRTHVTPLALNRLTRPQIAQMVERITGGKPFPAEVLQQIIDKTDGIPLFVMVGETLLFLGDIIRAYDRAEQGVALYEAWQQQGRGVVDQQDIPWVVSCQYTAAWSLWLLGYADQAAHRTRAALDLFQQLLPYGRAFFLNVTALMHRFRGEPQAVREHAEAAIEIATEHGFALMQARGTTLRGWALAAQGHREDGIAELRQGLDALRTAGQHAPLHYPLALVEAYRHVGQATAGLQLVTEIEALLETSDERLWQAELFRLKGELLLQSGDQRHGAEVWTPEATPETLQAEAEACFLEAFAVARSQQARSLELRAAMSLSRLRQQQGRRDDARQLLTEIYDWFTEGFDTADLQEARALLAKLP